MAIEMEISVGMLFRKMYCSKCGAELKRKKIKKKYKPGDEGFTRFSQGFGSTIINIGSRTVVRYVYECPRCHNITEYGEQCKIAELQKNSGTKILADGD